jgi:hypothetical protein
VPVLPINTALDENRQRSVIETQISALVHYVRSEIESYYKKSLESSDPATKKEASAFIETLKGLDVTKGIDFYQCLFLLTLSLKRRKNNPICRRTSI